MVSSMFSTNPKYERPPLMRLYARHRSRRSLSTNARERVHAVTLCRTQYTPIDFGQMALPIEFVSEQTTFAMQKPRRGRIIRESSTPNWQSQTYLILRVPISQYANISSRIVIVRQTVKCRKPTVRRCQTPTHHAMQCRAPSRRIETPSLHNSPKHTRY